MTDAVQSPAPRPLDQLATALAAFQAEMPVVPKGKSATVRSEKGSYSYTYAGLADVSEAVTPLLTKHGLSFSCLPGNGVLTGMLLHTSGQYLTGALPLSGSTPQQVGSALTYMRRYLLGCMTGLVTDDDDDGQAASARPPAARRSAPARRTPQTDPGSAQRPAPEATGGGGDSQPDAPGPGSNQVTSAQLKKIGAQMRDLGLTDRVVALGFVADVIGREVSSRNELTRGEASKLIERMAYDLGELPEPEGEQS